MIPPQRSIEPHDLARKVALLAEDKKAADIIVLDVAGLTTIAEAFVICTGGSEPQLAAITANIVDGMAAEGVTPAHRHRAPSSHWIVLDYGSVIVHVFTPPEREFYKLEQLWASAKVLLRIQ
ncbi:MAG: ribosome silencing factor [Chloroflexi bacterium]|nr:MAG: ribosome silencing factor [Chloroflexota bacterium]